MTPGLARGPPFPLKATKGAVVAVASVDKPSVPVVVGICDIDIASLQQIHGAKGHAVRTEHWDGDEIWRWSMTGKPAVSAPEYIEGWNVEIGIDSLEEKSQHLTIEDEDDDGEEGGVQLSSEESSKRPNVYVNGENAEPFEGLDEEKEMSTSGMISSESDWRGLFNKQSEIDNAFWQAFLYGVQKARNKHKDDQHHGLSFPIPQSLVISNLVLPFLPIHTARHTAALQIKKTSWKNAKKFIKALHKQNLLKSKDRDGGECVVLDIDFDDPAVVSFVPYKLPKKDTVGAEPGAGGAGKATAANSTSSDTSVGQHLQKISLYRPKEGLSAIFEAANASVKALYLPTELRPIITSYIESENLISGTNKQLVNLNPILANAVFDGHSSLDREVIAKGTVPRNALIDRILQSCSPFWVILHNNETRDSVKAKVGHPPKIQITHETRSGNKTVTRISGVEVFYVNPHLLAEELQKSCASSTSVNQLVGSSPKNPVQEIMVQGSQKDVVIKALEKRGVHRQWIEMLDKTKGKKR